MPGFTYEDADRWLGARATIERTCPECSASRKPEHRRLPCFGLRRLGDRILYACMNCDIEGVVTAGWQERPRNQLRERPRSPSVPQARSEDIEKPTAHLAAELWSSARSPYGTLAETYWKARNLLRPIPPTVRFSDRGGRPMLVGALGLPILDGEDWHAPIEVRGVQRIFLKPDGSGHEGKKSLGEVKGRPLVVFVNVHCLNLIVGEGLEKVRAIAEARPWCDAWASCGTSFFRHLAPVVPQHFEMISIVEDEGEAGEAATGELGELLKRRGFEVNLLRAWERPHA